MKKLHWSIILIILVCLGMLCFLGYIGIKTDKEIPTYLVSGLFSTISLLIGYGFGSEKGDNDVK